LILIATQKFLIKLFAEGEEPLTTWKKILILLVLIFVD
jgi:hypothetical protein